MVPLSWFGAPTDLKISLQPYTLRRLFLDLTPASHAPHETPRLTSPQQRKTNHVLPPLQNRHAPLPSFLLLPPPHQTLQNPPSTQTPSSLSFTSTLSSLLSRPPSPPGSRASRARAGKKDDIFTAHRRRRKDKDARGREGEQDIGGVDEETLERSRRKMEEKAKRYKAMKRGDVDVQEGGEGAGGLVEWDRKWTEAGEKGEGSEDDSELEEGRGTFADLEKVEFEDEYGRLREGTKAERDRMHRRLRNQLRGAEELDRMSARPAMPEGLIHGAAIQSSAFNPDAEIEVKMGELARKRDRSPTPPEAVHYDSRKEVRSRGVGFYQFSREGGGRKGEMEGLEGLRRETVGARGEDGGGGDGGGRGRKGGWWRG
ncbi:hypothetical protein VC83_01061 [Pseudogymnoascus destructans]|uniref:Uncharacterized protein n=1 Tax=Pseudogymnoascus destructans TaxID=655981 RepID=A0A177AN16_9PEZI|nr:uncharacterized protein VC83_01061 [Pseudogymnoascus destructans]OAF62554.1 hypothetical protein VC83_01061 [Pseudogymnoascus destructans]